MAKSQQLLLLVTLVDIFVLTLGSAAADSVSQNRHANDSLNFSLYPEVELTTYAETEGGVYHMEADLLIDGNILYVDDLSLKTTDGLTTNKIVQVGNAPVRIGFGDLGPLDVVRGFVQLSENEIVVTDFNAHCLRLINRLAQTISRYAGYCGSPSSNSRYFHYPHSVIQDLKQPSMLIVTDYYNHGLKYVNTSGPSSNQYHDVQKFTPYNSIRRPSGITQDPESGDLYVTSISQVYKFAYVPMRFTLVAGSSSRGFADRNLKSSMFDFLYDIKLAGGQKLVVADKLNNRLRVLDNKTDTTYSICSGSSGHNDGTSPRKCSLSSPQSLLVINQTLYVGENGKIRSVRDKRAGFCEELETRVMFAREKHGTGELYLPVGRYPNFRIKDGTHDCNITLVVFDPLLKRKLTFKVDYNNINCTAVNIDAGNTYLNLQVDNTCNMLLNDLCDNGKDCSEDESSRSKLSCADDTLTVICCTDVTVRADVTDMPSKSAIMMRLNESSIGEKLFMLVFTNEIRIVYPAQRSGGAYAEASLISYCEEGLQYNEEYDSCDP